MRRRRRDDALAELLSECALSSLIKQERVERRFGEQAWSLSLAESVLAVGGTHFAVDVVGTESRRSGSFLWSWCNRSFEPPQTPTARLVASLGGMRGAPTLFDDREIPLDLLDAHRAGMLAAWVGDADGYYVGDYGQGAVVLLLRGRVLRHEPFVPADVMPVLNDVAAGAFPLDARRAFESFAEDPLDGIAVDLDAESASVRLAGAGWTVQFDEHDRIAGVQARIDPEIAAPVSEDDDVDDEGELVTLGEVVLPDGHLCVLDPLLAHPAVAGAQPVALPAGRFSVAAALDDDPAGGRRVGAVFLRLGDEEPVWFQPLAYVPIDSGVGCFAAPDAAWRLVDGGDAAAEAVERSLAAVAQPTWAAAGDEDHVAFSTGLGAGLYDLSLGFSDADELVQVALTMLPDGSDAGTPTPAAGQQRAALVPLTMSGPPSPDNAVVLPAEARRRLTAAHRRAVRAWVEGARVETSFLPEYGSDPDVPVRIAIDVRAGPHSFSETIETSPAP